MEVASPSDQICSDRFLSILRKTNWIPQTGERSCHCPPPVNPLCAMSHHKGFDPLLPHLRALCDCMRDSTPLRSSAAASKGSLPVPLQKNLDQRTTPRAHSCRSKLENGVLLGTPSPPRVGWLPCRTVGGMSPDRWRIPGTLGSSVCPRPHSGHCKILGTWSLSLSSTGLEQKFLYLELPLHLSLVCGLLQSI